jgi:hypothetical protein
MKNGSNVIITVYLINVGTRYKLVVRWGKNRISKQFVLKKIKRCRAVFQSENAKHGKKKNNKDEI